ncbi:MAG: sigma-54 dependent transcriptional regulator [Vicinamibacterales bacterium]|nr:sigma-54 dependent transcriptional regulator [Vicinamibacterales bacterium]
MSAPRILVVDDEEELRVSVVKVLRRAGYEVEAAPDGVTALALVRQAPVHLLVTDFRLPDVDGLELMRQVRAAVPDCEVLMMTAYANIPLAVEAVREGAWDFLAKPFKKAELEHAVARALEKQALAAENRRLRLELADRTRGPGSRVIGQSQAIQAVMRVVEQVAPSTATVLVTGESGTGKEVIAEMLHRASPRRDQPLVKVNCAALPETLLEAELFGHERGAFTGAVARRDGRFALAHRGTLLLDEVGAISPAVQVKLLRVLQDGAFEPLGSTRTVRADVRIVAATNANLADEVAAGRFREDLFYRLNVIAITVPPLRERAEDIPVLAMHFVQQYAARNGKRVDTISRAAMERLVACHWPGNIRELEHAMERAVVLTGGRSIEPEHLPDAVRHVVALPAAEPAQVPVVAVPVGTPLEEVERLLIQATLKTTGGNKQRAADLLGIAARTIYRKLG